MADANLTLRGRVLNAIGSAHGMERAAADAVMAVVQPEIDDLERRVANLSKMWADSESTAAHAEGYRLIIELKRERDQARADLKSSLRVINYLPYGTRVAHADDGKRDTGTVVPLVGQAGPGVVAVTWDTEPMSAQANHEAHLVVLAKSPTCIRCGQRPATEPDEVGLCPPCDKAVAEVLRG